MARAHNVNALAVGLCGNRHLPVHFDRTRMHDCGGPSAALRGARSLACLLAMFRSLRSERLASGHLRNVFQQPPRCSHISFRYSSCLAIVVVMLARIRLIAGQARSFRSNAARGRGTFVSDGRRRESRARRAGSGGQAACRWSGRRSWPSTRRCCRNGACGPCLPSIPGCP